MKSIISSQALLLMRSLLISSGGRMRFNSGQNYGQAKTKSHA